jgi:uncharacterized membrane protein
MPRENGTARARVVGWLIFVAVVVGPVLGIGAPLWGAITGKSYDFPRVDIDATVQPDGSLDLVEERTFDFDGEFSFAFFTVDWPVEQIEGFSVSEDGHPIPVSTEESSSFQFKGRWEFAAEDEQRTFTISYRVRCAVDVWADTAHLNWQFIGTGHQVPTEHTFVRVHLPGAATGGRKPARPAEFCPKKAPEAPIETRPLREGETLAWGHGPLGGEVRIPDPQTVTLEVSDLPEATFVEGSIVFPETAVPLAYQVPAPMRESIVSSEAVQAEAANAQRRALLALEARYRSWRRVVWFALGALPVLFVALAVISRVRDRMPGVPKILQAPPEEIHPVELAQIWAAANGRTGTQHVYRTQMLHLANIGAIELQAVGPVSDPDDFRVRLRDVKDADPRDQEFLEFLFPKSTDEDIALSSLKPKGQRRTELRQWWKLVDTSSKSAIKRMLPELRWESIATTLLGLAGIVGGGILAVMAGGPVGLLLIPVALVGMTIAHVLIRPRIGEQARERIARWRAFRRFLTEFSSLPEAPTLAVIIWEQYLVYATALGVADEVENQVKAIIPPEELPSPWEGAPSGMRGYAFMHSFNTVPVHSAASTSVSSTSSGIGSFSSGGGGGGGFSGGGGGGGGGTGSGAG